MDRKIDSKQNNETIPLGNFQKLITDLNRSLLELKKEKDEYRSRINECRGLCHKIRELMNATTTRIIGKPVRD